MMLQSVKCMPRSQSLSLHSNCLSFLLFFFLIIMIRGAEIMVLCILELVKELVKRLKDLIYTS